ncbi:MAG TPA: TetR/AcrR family transcriptional regulator [Burkholderiales bacterium]|nr:TetR/AcrR family transcriptional regulator [Burkholderiales bacterium]
MSRNGALNAKGAAVGDGAARRRRRRSSGQGTTRDPERTRARILDAATQEFARFGLGGARVDRIAVRAAANKRMLYYYFGDKEGLFLAVLENAYVRIRSAEQALRLLDTPPVAAVARLVEFTWGYYLAHPEFLTLLNSENLHRARHLKRSRNIRSMNSPLIATLGEILRRGEAQGVFRRGVDPLQLYISIAGLAYFFLSNSHTLSRVFARNLAAAAVREQRLAHMTEIVVGYLTNRARKLTARGAGG